MFVLQHAQTGELALPDAHEGAGLRGLAFSPDGRRLALAGDRSLVVYDRAADAWVPASGVDRGSVYDHDVEFELAFCNL